MWFSTAEENLRNCDWFLNGEAKGENCVCGKGGRELQIQRITMDKALKYPELIKKEV